MAIRNALDDRRPGVFDRRSAARWLECDGRQEIKKDLVDNLPEGVTIFVAAGITDPDEQPGKIRHVNLDLPIAIIEALKDHSCRIITFGTVMETFAPSDNPYVLSKTELSSFIEQQSGLQARLHHVRLHTLFGGGPPHPHMFLGQIEKAIRHRQKFSMTAGAQLREYHHVDDVARVLVALFADADKPEMPRSMTLSHGNPVRLVDLALEIFGEFDLPDLLEIGAIQSPAGENYGHRFPPSPLPDDLQIRCSIESVIAYLREHLQIAKTVSEMSD